MNAPRKSPKWAAYGMFLGALFAFAASGLVFSGYARAAMVLGLVAMGVYVVCLIGIISAKRKH